MNLEEAIEWFRGQQSRKAAFPIRSKEEQEKFERTQKEVMAKAAVESMKDINEAMDQAREKMKAEQELLRKALQQQPVQSGYRGVSNARVSTASFSASYATSYAYPLASSNEDRIRASLEQEYKVKLKEEVERVRKEMRGTSGQPVEVELLGQGRKFKLEG